MDTRPQDLAAACCPLALLAQSALRTHLHRVPPAAAAAAPCCCSVLPRLQPCSDQPPSGPALARKVQGSQPRACAPACAPCAARCEAPLHVLLLLTTRSCCCVRLLAPPSQPSLICSPACSPVPHFRVRVCLPSCRGRAWSSLLPTCHYGWRASQMKTTST